MWLAFLFACANNTSEPIVQDQKPTNDPVEAKGVDGEDTATDNPLTYEGETVSLTGKTAYKGEATGYVQMEILLDATDLSKSPQLLHRQKLTGLGDFEVKVPTNTEQVTLMVYIDIKGDGMNANDEDPRGVYTFDSKEDKVENIEITIMDMADWKNLKDDRKKDQKTEKPAERFHTADKPAEKPAEK